MNLVCGVKPLKSDYIWFDGKFVKYKDAKLHVLSHSLHYGSAAFEGIRFYETDDGVAVFRLKEHYKRMKKSAEVMHIKHPYSVDDLCKATLRTIKKNKLEHGYVRPIAFFGLGNLRVEPTACKTHVIIAAWPWGAYLSEDPIKVKVSKYIRIHPKSLESDAKICGHYVNSILAVYDAKAAGFQEALLLDYKGNIAEGPGENFFIVKNGKLITPPLGNILPGITRDSIIKLAKDLGIPVQERNISLKQAKQADECFFSGTAAEVTPIGQIDASRIKHGFGPITKQLKAEFMNIVHGKNKKYRKWLTYV